MKFRKVYVEISNICNLKCSFCPGTIRPVKYMTKEEFTLVCQKIRPYTDFIYFHIMGEPLTHPELPSMIAMARENGFYPAITTNGTLLDFCGEKLIAAGVYKVNISVHSFEDGTEEEYHRYIKQCMDFADLASKAGVLVVLRLWNNGYDNGRNEDIEHILHK